MWCDHVCHQTKQYDSNVMIASCAGFHNKSLKAARSDFSFVYLQIVSKRFNETRKRSIILCFGLMADTDQFGSIDWIWNHTIFSSAWVDDVCDICSPRAPIKSTTAKSIVTSKRKTDLIFLITKSENRDI